MFNPIVASRNIHNEFIDYITTSFSFADKAYEASFREALHAEGAVAKGPYLDIGGSYEAGRSLHQLMDSGDACGGFEILEQEAEEKKELKLERPLYLHQEKALLKANAGKSLIVTTGTGSGKTECFLIPVVNHLLREMENGTLDDAVRAIIIYPMNALANDQLKRMRALLKDRPEIRFGLYNGNTKHRKSDALKDYYNAHGSEKPLSNEILSREEMQERPPHILITNYSMMEYMLLRPQDDSVFKNAQLKYIILDEAHIYRGATGMETSLLLRRMRARIAHRGQLQYILTSATLGDADADQEILNFGHLLCGVDFERDCIIRSRLKEHKNESLQDIPNAVFAKLSAQEKSVSDVLSEYNICFDPAASDPQKLFDLCLNSRHYEALRTFANRPLTISTLLSRMCQMIDLTEAELTTFIDVCARAEKNGANLIRPRYHFFVRALEGAYITIGKNKQLYLNRLNAVTSADGEEQAVFEAAICTDCGRVALTGKRNENGILVQQSTMAGRDVRDYYMIKNPDDNSWFTDDEDDETTANDYIICSRCGMLHSDNGSDREFCDHTSSEWVKLYKIAKTPAGVCRCPACGTGSMRTFYLGSEAATAVLGTDLYEQLPESEVVRQAEPQEARGGGLFGKRRVQKPVINEKVRQFLCFSDSRSEAAYFASYMERSYQQFLRRRGIWHVAEELRQAGRYHVTMAEFIHNLTTYFEKYGSFKEWDDRGSAYVSSKGNAWIAVLDELFNARRATGLISMGVFSVKYRLNDKEMISAVAGNYGISEAEMEALLELLVMDGVHSGAIDAGEDHRLSDADREYIFFAATPQRLVKVKNAGDPQKSSQHGWCARRRTNGNYFPNVKISRLCAALNISESEANDFLEQYWSDILPTDSGSFAFDANDFDVLLYDFDRMPFYRCKKCGRVTPHNVQNRCVNVKCTGELEPFDALKATEGNHYANLYRSTQMKPLYIKEHTAQLSKTQQSRYQDAFVAKRLNALSCSTTFEMGVDVGSLETVYMRNVPPSPSNYVQRAGRAGRGRNSAAFVLTYSKLSSHDFTYYANPENMISGNIGAPIFRLENEKIIRRHIFATALGYFFKRDPEAYDGDNRAAFLLEGGYQRFKDMMRPVPEELDQLLKTSIPEKMHASMGITTGKWVEDMIGDGDPERDVQAGVLESVYQAFHSELAELEKLAKQYHRNRDADLESRVNWQLRRTRAGRNDEVGRRSLIDFLVRNNILPKYGFPVDTVELHPYGNAAIGDEKDQLQLSRDLQMAIAEYAPGSEIIADGKLYKSRYIRKSYTKAVGVDWETGSFANCSCGQMNFTKEFIPKGAGKECVSCRNMIPFKKWHPTIEPRRGFQAESDGTEVPLKRPERGMKTEDYYIGDQNHRLINRRRFEINGGQVILESTANDSLVVISSDQYRVCPRCGYATDGEWPDKHKNGRGFFCEGKGKETKEYHLSHDFKTDVAKVTFIDNRAYEKNLMFSVMFALLEGLSRAMGIERNDIKGCLYHTDTDHGMIYSLVLYDAVAGGAGNVRRMVTGDGKAFSDVVRAALEMLRSCKCDTSCYNCLRNYYNQKIHDKLDRNAAIHFLESWAGMPVPVAEEDAEEALTVEEVTDENLVQINADEDLLADYSNWMELAEVFDDYPALAEWDKAGIPYRGIFLGSMKIDDTEIEPVVIWPDEKAAVCESEALLSLSGAKACGWRFFDMSANPEDILKALEGGNE